MDVLVSNVPQCLPVVHLNFCFDNLFSLITIFHSAWALLFTKTLGLEHIDARVQPYLSGKY